MARKLAEGVGFEPTVPGGTHALQACPIDHSGTPPGATLLGGSGGGGGIRTHGTSKTYNRSRDRPDHPPRPPPRPFIVTKGGGGRSRKPLYVFDVPWVRIP